MSESFRQFRQSIQSCRHVVCGSEDSFFYIYEELRQIVTKSVIADLIIPVVPDHTVEDVVMNIQENGIRLFCILALMDQLDKLPNFLTHNTLDSRLPIRENAELRAIAPSLSDLFFTRYQWEFFPWIFQKHHGHVILSENTILPFISSETLAEGSGGFVSLVKIPALQQGFLINAEKNILIVRKRIKASKTIEGTQAMFESESECLRLYRRLHHPNIIPLLGSFTIGSEHNLLFPWFPKNLETFLKEDRVGNFAENTTFTSALADLATALQYVHEANWRSRIKPTFYTKYGYHHDFRPANILVSDSTFILADFGLGQIASTPPVLKWQENIGHYIAPECMDKSFEPQLVGNSYDIWAFGCFLSEIATYMALGPSGVKEFELRRKTDMFYEMNYKNYYFFDGMLSSVKPQVNDWLEELSSQTKDRTVVSLASLSKEMLQFSPNARLNMAAQSIRLFFIHAKCLFHLAIKSMEKTLSQVDQLQSKGSLRASEEIRIELSKLRAFGECLHMNDDNELECTHFKDARFRELVISCLTNISANQNVSKAELAKHIHQWSNEGPPLGAVTEMKPPEVLDESIQKEIRRLCNILPNQEYFEHLFQKHLFGASPSEKRLRILEQCGKEEPDLYADVGLQAKLHRLDKALLEGAHATANNETDLILDWSQISDELTTFSRYHNIGAYSCSSPSGVKEKYKILIEWVFISQFPQGESETVRIDKLLRLARLLHLSKPPGFCTLSCLGFLPPKPDSPYQSGYGFVYPLPKNGDMEASVKPESLRELLNIAKFPIALDQKFMIARNLANSLFQLHSHGWLHKNICSDNVMFCGHESKTNGKNQARYTITNGPYIIGFHHGRPENEVFCSDVPSSGADLDALLYRHPAYNPGDNRFRKAYDRYSLAIIMIELAYWSPAKKFGRDKGSPLFGDQILEVFDRKFRRGLVESMGTAYMEAARACLDEADITQTISGSDRGSLSGFYSKVVERLDKCYVG